MVPKEDLFVPVPLIAYDDPTVSHAAKLTYGRLLFCRGLDGKCFPGRDYLAAPLGVSTKQIGTILNELKALGWITWKRTRSSNHYTLIGPGSSRNKGANQGTPGSEENFSSDEKKTSHQIGRKLPIRSEENFPLKDVLKDLRKDPLKDWGTNTDPDLLPPHRKNHDATSAGGGCKQYPKLKEALIRAFHEDGQEDLPPSDRLVVDVMHVAAGASEADVVECLRYIRDERDLRPGGRNGPHHWSWYTTVVADYFSSKRIRDQVIRVSA